MLADTIRLLITNTPALLFVLAVVIPALRRAGPRAEAYLSWLLLLSVGAEGLWSGLFHVLTPETAAAFIGWQVSPFQFEIGIADIALGAVAVISFWRPLDFKAAVVIFASIFYVGLAVGHLQQIVTTGNFAPGNAGILLVLTVIRPALLIGLLLSARRTLPAAA